MGIRWPSQAPKDANNTSTVNCSSKVRSTRELLGTYEHHAHSYQSCLPVRENMS